MVFVSCMYGSVRDQEFTKILNELMLICGCILKDFNYCSQETVFSSENGKLLLIRDLLHNKYFIQKVNPPEPWTANEPNVVCYSKSVISGNTFGLLADMGYVPSQQLVKVGYEFTFVGINILLLRVCTSDDKGKNIHGNLWLLIVKSPEYSNSNDGQKYTQTIKTIQTLLSPLVQDLGSVDHILLRMQ